MRPELFMREEKDAIDLFAAFMNVNSMQATEQNFSKLRKEVDRAEKRIMKEVRMKRMKGVSVGRHPFFQKRGSFDGEKMVVALRIEFNRDGLEHYKAISDFIKKLRFKERSMAIASITARGTNNRGTIEEFDYNRPVTHLSVGDAIKGIVEDMEEVVKNRDMMAKKSKKKPLNRDRRMKEVFKKDKPKRRGEQPPTTKKFKDKTKYDRKRQEKVGMDKIAAELVKVARELVAEVSMDGARNSLRRLGFKERKVSGGTLWSSDGVDLRIVSKHLKQAGFFFNKKWSDTVIYEGAYGAYVDAVAVLRLSGSEVVQVELKTKRG